MSQKWTLAADPTPIDGRLWAAQIVDGTGRCQSLRFTAVNGAQAYRVAECWCKHWNERINRNLQPELPFDDSRFEQEPLPVFLSRQAD